MFNNEMEGFRKSVSMIAESDYIEKGLMVVVKKQSRRFAIRFQLMVGAIVFTVFYSIFTGLFQVGISLSFIMLLITFIDTIKYITNQKRLVILSDNILTTGLRVLRQ